MDLAKAESSLEGRKVEENEIERQDIFSKEVSVQK